MTVCWPTARLSSTTKWNKRPFERFVASYHHYMDCVICFGTVLFCVKNALICPFWCKMNIYFAFKSCGKRFFCNFAPYIIFYSLINTSKV